MVYAGFWRRFAALWLDFIFWIPMTALMWWGAEHYRLFHLYFLVPNLAFTLFYEVYLVRRFGGTPGKRVMKVSIRKVDGSPVGYREALLRYLPQGLLGVILLVATIIADFQLTDAEFFSAPSFIERAQLVKAATPVWAGPFEVLMHLWIWSEFIVMMTNRKRRALHDFIAGTVVIRDSIQRATPTDTNVAT